MNGKHTTSVCVCVCVCVCVFVKSSSLWYHAIGFGFCILELGKATFIVTTIYYLVDVAPFLLCENGTSRNKLLKRISTGNNETTNI